MLYHIAGFLLLRTPLNSTRDYQNDHLDEILADPTFRSALLLASAGFYDNLEKKNFEPANLSEKEKNTIRKYYNRSCFRSTPFGLFSSVSLVHWGNRSLSFSNSDQEVALAPDQGFVNRIGLQITERPLISSARFETNPILYRMGDEYRFVRSGLDELLEKREYLLQSIAFSQVLKKLFDFCRTARSRREIAEHIAQLADCEANEATAYLEFLIDAQILLNTLRPNLTGMRYLERLHSAINQNSHPNSFSEFTGNSVIQMDTQGITPDKLKAAATGFGSFGHLPGQTGEAIKLGGVFERKVSGNLEADWKAVLEDGLYALDKLCPEPTNPLMEEFARNFNMRFEHQSLPLLEALDPEVGIGYFLQPAANGPLLETLDVQALARTGSSLTWTKAHSLLLNQWNRSSGNHKAIIQLQKTDLEILDGAGGDKQFLGGSVLFRIAGQQLFIESAGGVNSLALFGRFTPDHPAIYQAAKKIAEEQEVANPDVMFAEILHLLNPRAENVAIRENIWNWDIPLTAVSTRPQENQLLLNDLFVRVNDGTVYLWSKTHKKIVIPRLTSAYNHQLNQLPLFRFLADLPFQYGRSGLTLSLSQFFPGLDFYPRVSYQECILHLATWILNESEIRLLQHDHPELILQGFAQLDSSRNLPAVFTLSEGDQQLVFFKHNDAEVLFLAESLRNKKEAVIQEFLNENETDSLIKDEAGRPFVNQFNLPLIPKAPLAKRIYEPTEFADYRNQRKFVPGSEWLYLKIYSSRTSSAKLLYRIYPLIQKKYTRGKILKWFFIRYEDHAPHIRLRLRIHPEDTGEILSAFKGRLEDKIRQQVIREYQVDVYSRELERYQSVSYDLTENLFWASSELVYHWLKNEKGSPLNKDHLLAIRGLRDILELFIPEPEEQVKFSQHIYKQLMEEFRATDLKRDLDKKYREFSEQIREALKDEFYPENRLSKQQFLFIRALREIAESQAEVIPMIYLSGIIHMHLNRIFTAEPRKQEMIVYYLFQKFLLSEIARTKP